MIWILTLMIWILTLVYGHWRWCMDIDADDVDIDADDMDIDADVWILMLMYGYWRWWYGYWRWWHVLVAVPWLGGLIAGLSPRGPGFDPKWQGNYPPPPPQPPEYFGFPVSGSFHLCSIHIFICVLLSPGQTSEAWEPSKQQSSYGKWGRNR
jgi:hypothetical protein